MIEESKNYTGIMKKHLNKELVMTNKDNGDFKKSTKCWTCMMIMLKAMLK